MHPTTLLALAGAAAFGLMWGWLLVLRRPSRRKVWPAALALAAATMLIALVVMGMAGWQAVIAFAVGLLVGLWSHMAWLESLRRRSRRS